MNAGGILEQILDPLTDCLTPQAASKIVDFEVDAETQERVTTLAVKAQSGSLSEADKAEYHDLIEAFDLVAMLKSKARVLLKKPS